MPKPSAKELVERIYRGVTGETVQRVSSLDLAERVEKVLALHVEMVWEDMLGGPDHKTGHCDNCDAPWPCPTRRALDDEEE